MDAVIIAALGGTFCLGALLGIALAYLYWSDRWESRAEELYAHMSDWDRKHRKMSQRNPHQPYTGG